MKEEKRKHRKSTEENERKAVNKWKVSFIILLGIILGLAAFFFFRATQQREVIQYDTQPIVQREGEPVLSINSNKEQINLLMDFYLQNYQADSDVEYHFQLENQAMLTGDFEVLGAPITFICILTHMLLIMEMYNLKQIVFQSVLWIFQWVK